MRHSLEGELHEGFHPNMRKKWDKETKTTQSTSVKKWYAQQKYEVKSVKGAKTTSWQGGKEK